MTSEKKKMFPLFNLVVKKQKCSEEVCKIIITFVISLFEHVRHLYLIGRHC